MTIDFSIRDGEDHCGQPDLCMMYRAPIYLSDVELQDTIRAIGEVLPSEYMPNLQHVEFVHNSHKHEIPVPAGPYVTALRV